MSAACNLCKVPLNQPGKPETKDCGGDCLQCMAEAGDPECKKAMGKIRVDGLVLQILRKSAWNFIRRATPEQLRLMRDAIDKRLANAQNR